LVHIQLFLRGNGFLKYFFIETLHKGLGLEHYRCSIDSQSTTGYVLTVDERVLCFYVETNIAIYEGVHTISLRNDFFQQKLLKRFSEILFNCFGYYLEVLVGAIAEVQVNYF